METLTRDMPSSMNHHSSVTNMKHSYVQVLIITILYSSNILILLYLFHTPIYIFYNFKNKLFQLSKTCLDEDAQINKKLPKELLLRYNLNYS